MGAGFPPGIFFIGLRGGNGTCRVTVSFLSGAPNFVTEVQVGPSNPCCPYVNYPTPSFIDVPDVDVPDGGTDAATRE